LVTLNVICPHCKRVEVNQDLCINQEVGSIDC
jgi:hypothetical protein